jgi:hypothetical protein
MADSITATIQEIVIHQVGSKAQEEPLQLAAGLCELDDATVEWMQLAVSEAFAATEERFQFTHENDLSFNVAHQLSLQAFNAQLSFFDWSVELSKHLYECSLHPKVKGGDLIFMQLKNLVYKNLRCDALAIFKVDQKDAFFQYGWQQQRVDGQLREGIQLQKPEKAALIIKTHPEENELEVLLIDKNARGSEAAYWKADFLGLSHINNAYRQTKQFLQATKVYFEDQFSKDFDAERADAIDMMNKSVKYFKENEAFDLQDFEEKVFNDARLAASFRAYDETLKQEGTPLLPEATSFDIHQDAVKKQARIFKSVIKLDKNFHIYIHGNRDWVEKGVDPETGKKFYKLYFDSEA